MDDVKLRYPNSYMQCFGNGIQDEIIYVEDIVRVIGELVGW